LTHCAARWRQTCALFFKIGKFKRPSLTHGTTQGHQIFTFAKQTGVLVDYQYLSRSLYNWEEILCAKFRKIAKKIVKVWGPLTRDRGGNSKKWFGHSFLILSLNDKRFTEFISLWHTQRISVFKCPQNEGSAHICLWKIFSTASKIGGDI